MLPSPWQDHENKVLDSDEEQDHENTGACGFGLDSDWYLFWVLTQTQMSWFQLQQKSDGSSAAGLNISAFGTVFVQADLRTG